MCNNRYTNCFSVALYLNNNYNNNILIKRKGNKMTNTNKAIQRLAINIKSILKQNNMEYSQAFIDVNRIIILAGENTKPIRQLGIGIRSKDECHCPECSNVLYEDGTCKYCRDECPADKDDRLYHEQQDIKSMEKAKENK